MNQPKSNRKISRYQNIAVEVARRIASGEYAVGDKIKSRSTLSSTFNVSPETVRKGVAILADQNIVSARHGSGIWIESQERALAFVQKHEQSHALTLIKQDIQDQLETQKLEMERLEQSLDDLFQQVRSEHGQFALTLHRLKIDETWSSSKKTLNQLNIWDRTGATIVALGRHEKLRISPNPRLVPRPGDILYFVGEESALEQMQLLFDPERSTLQL